MRFKTLALIALCFLGCNRQGGEPPADPQPSAVATAQGLPAMLPMQRTGSLTPPTEPTQFTFVVFGDNRPGKGEPQPETIHEIFTNIRDLEPRPAFAISLGDIVEGKDPQASTAAIEEQFSDFLDLAALANTPVFNAPGNHEMDDDNDVPSERMHRLYEEHVGPAYGAFDYGNCRFIFLNTENIPPAGTPAPEPPLEFSYMSQQQLQELAADLEANRDKTHIFIAMHYPLKPKTAESALNPQDLQTLSELFAQYDNISYVLAAHEHLYYNAADPENVATAPGFRTGSETVYLVSGGAGAPLYDTTKWSFHHYMVFTVNGEEVSVSLHRLESSGAGS